MRVTKPASRNELRKGATTTAARTKTPALFKLSKRSGPSIDRRMRKAPRSASHELLRKNASDMTTGTPLGSCTKRCAENAPRRTTHHCRVGSRSSAASRIEFGGHRAEGECEGNFSAKPMSAPTQYATPTSATLRNRAL